MPQITTPYLAAGSLNRLKQPEIRTGDLLLRPWMEADADALMAAFTDAAIQRWHVRTIASRDEALEMIAGYQQDWREETSAHWVVVGPDLVGRVALKALHLGEGSAEMAYWVIASERGRGVAVRAAVALSAWAFDVLGLHRLGLGHAVANTASCRVAEKAGFAAEGVKRSAWLHADGFHDVHLHARLNGDD